METPGACFTFTANIECGGRGTNNKRKAGQGALVVFISLLSLSN